MCQEDPHVTGVQAGGQDYTWQGEPRRKTDKEQAAVRRTDAREGRRPPSPSCSPGPSGTVTGEIYVVASWSKTHLRMDSHNLTPLNGAFRHLWYQHVGTSLARHCINQSNIQISKLIKSVSGPSNVFYLCPSRVPSFSWKELVPLWMTEGL